MTPLVLATLIGCALVAGIFYAFSTFVMRAFARLERPQGIAAMQSINVTVLNPLFFLAFFGTGALCLATIVLSLQAGSGTDRTPLLVGSALYLVGCLGVTVAFNVPLNNRLATVAPSDPAGAALWDLYLERWTRWNHVRTAASLGAAMAFAVALGAT